ncbi:cytochrome c-type biogenesis protein CcmH [Acuticoccus sp. MNP-M23]|uniref:cytochrome c-type biogenesis protein n=1 Tax=Acuticoccus sp. MNP-M23 TaxID=3072793 RepID=UPI0028152B6A|nr:cytochrome c-type biogenesis protein CcmH [Acuticoccus sp. MNP-M23]WMS41648.1 cytochrome c-type biogenesis protein CcmH [Acuticoccus sp. MNP-M23]
MRRVVAALLTLGLLVGGAALAANPSEQLADPALEARARALGQELRCLVCQNQSIDASDAELAKDLRLLVRERISAGDSDEAVLSYLTDRYGAFVRLRPPMNAATIALWAAPLVVVLIAGIGAAVYLRGRRRLVADTPALSADEEKALAAMLDARKRQS